MAYDLEAKATATSSSDHHVRREKSSSGGSATASRISKKKNREEEEEEEEKVKKAVTEKVWTDILKSLWKTPVDLIYAKLELELMRGENVKLKRKNQRLLCELEAASGNENINKRKKQRWDH
ncbi:hypothetical protein AB3S75_006524 [Citrus x aurantiifolia]